MTEKQSLIDNGTLSDIRHIVPDEVLESDMSCGGRLALDSHLRSIEKEILIATLVKHATFVYSVLQKQKSRINNSIG